MSGAENPAAFPMGNPTDGGHDGMTLRDWFAGQALAGFTAANDAMLRALAALAEEEGQNTSQIVARLSYERADAMLAAREVQS